MSVTLRTVRATDADIDAVTDALADLLVDCTEGGASVGFMSPLSRDRARAFWEGVVVGVGRGERTLLAAIDATPASGTPTGIVGTVQLVPAAAENQPHRADISKMLVAPSARRRGIGELLMRGAEAAAIESGRTLLVLDTASDDALRLYQRLGWTLVGVIPDFALWPDGRPVDTTLFYKRLTTS